MTEHQSQLLPEDNKFHKGNGDDGKHYWLSPAWLLAKVRERWGDFFDPCPYPKPDDFDGLRCEWGPVSYVNPPFGSIIHAGKKKGMTAWVRKAIAEHQNGKTVVMVYPLDKWILMLVEAGARIENLRDVKWLATEDGSEGKGTGRHIACFILDGRPAPEVAALLTALEQMKADYLSPECTVAEAAGHLLNEMQRRAEIAHDAIAAFSNYGKAPLREASAQ